ncbi:MAG: 2-amino-4-hydroxy-6-hydroxymethyldihydropteridine diphosphokinase [Staphylococcus epidermidis]|nr:2-amino-4-hydroxy-6-hydroxymethyldihydropteridine diphosphokinase [Staphylococcus epidermidis]
MVKAYLGLGSNIGNRELQLNEAIKILHDYQGIQVTQVSHIYETEPVGYTNQPKFLNLCIEIETLDIDILLFGDQIIEQDNLSVPHPRMKERSFVLIPLNDIATKQIEPISNKSIGQLVVPDNSVKKYKE